MADLDDQLHGHMACFFVLNWFLLKCQVCPILGHDHVRNNNTVNECPDITLASGQSKSAEEFTIHSSVANVLK